MEKSCRRRPRNRTTPEVLYALHNAGAQISQLISRPLHSTSSAALFSVFGPRVTYPEYAPFALNHGRLASEALCKGLLKKLLFLSLETFCKGLISLFPPCRVVKNCAIDENSFNSTKKAPQHRGKSFPKPQKKFISLNEIIISLNEIIISLNETAISFNEMNFLLGLGKVFSRDFGMFLPGVPILLGYIRGNEASPILLWPRHGGGAGVRRCRFTAGASTDTRRLLFRSL